MQLTQVLLRQHIGRYFTNHWNVRSKRKILKNEAEAIVTALGVTLHEPNDLLKQEYEYKQIDVVGIKSKPVPLDETHPLWHAKPLLTYKDNNVLLEGLMQAKILTKTVELKQGLPDSIILKDISKDVNNLCKKIVFSSHLFDAEQKKLPVVKDPQRPAWNFPRTYGITQDRVNKLITTKFLHLIENTSDYNLVKDKFVFNDLHFSFPFEKDDELFQFQLRGDVVLASSIPLSPITNDPTDMVDLPNIFPIKHTITLNEENIYELNNIYPIRKNVIKSHPHTIIVHFNKEEVKNLYEEEVTETQIFGRSLLKTFTAAAAYAKHKYGNEVKSLPKPVVVQCIQTNGRLFHFGILQLNTLDLEEGGTKNVWYQTEMLSLFQKCCYDVGKPILEGYNNDIIKHLYAFYNNV